MKRYTKKYVVPGQRFENEMPFSEACMSMQIAGKVLEVELTSGKYPMAQLYKDGQEYSFPVTTGEAGIYQDSEGYYISRIEQ